jgi:hypothetical protein
VDWAPLLDRLRRNHLGNGARPAAA